MFAARRRLAGDGAALLLLLAITAVADDFFSPLRPLLAPITGSLCKTVACGTMTTAFPGFRCDCEPGWKQMHVGDAGFVFGSAACQARPRAV